MSYYKWFTDKYPHSVILHKLAQWCFDSRWPITCNQQVVGIRALVKPGSVGALSTPVFTERYIATARCTSGNYCTYSCPPAPPSPGHFVCITHLFTTCRLACCDIPLLFRSSFVWSPLWRRSNRPWIHRGGINRDPCICCGLYIYIHSLTVQSTVGSAVDSTQKPTQSNDLTISLCRWMLSMVAVLCSLVNEYN